jgi:hypothetical protein
MKTTNRNYLVLTHIAKRCGMIPYTDRMGKVKDGFYTLEGLDAPIDLTACAEDEQSILRTAVRQLSELADEAYHASIERDLQD